MKLLVIVSFLLSSVAFAGGNRTEVNCKTAEGNYTIDINTRFGTVAVVRASEVTLRSFTAATNTRKSVDYQNNLTAQAYIDNNGYLSAIFEAEAFGHLKIIRFDIQSQTIKTLDVDSGQELLEESVVCDEVVLDV